MKISRRLGWLVLTLVVVATLLLPGSAQAQEKVDLTIRLVSGFRNEVKAGQDNTFFLELRNIGDKPLTNIRLSAEGPKGWVVRFNPDRISSLAPKNLQTVDLIVKPDEKASRRDYNITVIADASEIRKVEIIWLRVEAVSYWLWVGVIVAAVVVAGFIFIYLRFGRK